MNGPTTDSDTNRAHDRNSVLSRRSVVQSAVSLGFTAGVLGVSGSVAATASDEEVIEAGNQTIQIESGESWENKLIDMTTGDDIIVVAQGTDWTIRNIGFTGRNTSGAGTATFGVADTGGNSSTLENVYLGDGSDDRNASSTGHGQTAVWVHPDHSGHLDISRMNIQGFADNAIYASAPGTGGGGTVHVDQCFAANCHVSHYRLATDGSAVTNSTVVVDDDGFDGRGIWVWGPGPVTVENCHLDMNGANYAIVCGANDASTTAEISSTQYDTAYEGGIRETAGSSADLGPDVGTEPEPTIPADVPRSAEEAAESTSRSREQTLAVDSSSGDEAVHDRLLL